MYASISINIFRAKHVVLYVDNNVFAMQASYLVVRVQMFSGRFRYRQYRRFNCKNNISNENLTGPSSVIDYMSASHESSIKHEFATKSSRCSHLISMHFTCRASKVDPFTSVANKGDSDCSLFLPPTFFIEKRRENHN